MTADQILAAIDLYEAELSPRRQAAEYPHEADCESRYDSFCHLLAMFPKMREQVAAGQLEKAFRWLGFAQGVLWAHGHYTLNELKDHNR